MIARSCIGVNRKIGKCFWRPGAAPHGGRSPPPQALPAVSPSGRKAAPPWWEDGSGLRGGSGLCCGGMAAGCCGQRATAGGDGSGLWGAAGYCGRRWQRAAAGGRPAGRAAKPHTAPAGGGGGLRPGGAEGLPAVLLRGAAARPQKTRPGKPQFSGPGLVLIDSPCARSGGVFPPGSGQGRWYRRGSW